MKQLTSGLGIIIPKANIFLFTYSEGTISEMAKPLQKILLIWKLDSDQTDKIKKSCS
jgi:hypothetical protein